LLCLGFITLDHSIIHSIISPCSASRDFPSNWLSAIYRKKIEAFSSQIFTGISWKKWQRLKWLPFFPCRVEDGRGDLKAQRVAIQPLSPFVGVSVRTIVLFPSCQGSYRDEPTSSRAELSSVGFLHPPGAPIYCGSNIQAKFAISAILIESLKVQKALIFKPYLQKMMKRDW